MTRSVRIRVAAATATSALILAGCSSEPDVDPDVEPEAVEELYAEDLETEGLPDTPAGQQLAWILQSLHPDSDLPTPGQVADRMGPPLDGMLQPGNLLSAFHELRLQGPWRVVDATEGEAQATATLIDADQDEEMVVHVTVDSDGIMIGLFLADGEEADGMDAGMEDGDAGTEDSDTDLDADEDGTDANDADADAPNADADAADADAEPTGEDGAHD